MTYLPTLGIEGFALRIHFGLILMCGDLKMVRQESL